MGPVLTYLLTFCFGGFGREHGCNFSSSVNPLHNAKCLDEKDLFCSKNEMILLRTAKNAKGGLKRKFIFVLASFSITACWLLRMYGFCVLGRNK